MLITTTYGFDGVSRVDRITQNVAGTADDQTYTFDYTPASQITERGSSLQRNGDIVIAAS